MRWARQLNSYLCKLSSSSNSFSPCAMICSHGKSRLTPCSITPIRIVQMLYSQGCIFYCPSTHTCVCAHKATTCTLQGKSNTLLFVPQAFCNAVTLSIFENPSRNSLFPLKAPTLGGFMLFPSTLLQFSTHLCSKSRKSPC